jgi:hypothetical protein
MDSLAPEERALIDLGVDLRNGKWGARSCDRIVALFPSTSTDTSTKSFDANG